MRTQLIQEIKRVKINLDSILKERVDIDLTEKLKVFKLLYDIEQTDKID